MDQGGINTEIDAITSRATELRRMGERDRTAHQALLDYTLGVLQVLQTDMSDRLNELAALRRDRDSLAEQLRRRDELMALLAHELRNPLAPIRSAATLLRSASDLASIDPRRIGALVERNVRHLVRLADDLLDLERISRGKLELCASIVDLRAVARDAIDCVTDAARGKQHALLLRDQPRIVAVKGDPTRLRQVVMNLLDNAIKYTPAGGHVEIEIRRENGLAVIVVRDDGVGLPPEALDRIFELFEQGRHGEGGLGVGLALVRRLVGLHAGTVTAHSEGIGHGSRFEVRIPLCPVLERATREIPCPDSGPHDPKRVLIVDGDEDAGSMLAAVVRSLGHVVECAVDGKTAVAGLDETRPDVVLLDIDLPDMDGLEVARAVLDRDAKTRVVAVTGHGDQRTRERCHRFGVSAHLLKPVDVAALRAQLTIDRAYSA
jgi:signal transduction histidine kinase